MSRRIKRSTRLAEGRSVDVALRHAGPNGRGLAGLRSVCPAHDHGRQSKLSPLCVVNRRRAWPSQPSAAGRPASVRFRLTWRTQ